MSEFGKLVEFYNKITVLDVCLLEHLADETPIIRMCANILYKEIGKARAIIDETIQLIDRIIKERK